MIWDSKYKNEKVCVNGDVFDSKREYQRWCELLLLERVGKIQDLERQVRFELVPAQYKDGKKVESAAWYVADFVYYQDGEKVVEDAKGCRTREYILKRKLMLQRHGIKIREV